MVLQLPIPRLHLFEIDDQPWYHLPSPKCVRSRLNLLTRFPQSLREKVQACLSLCWKSKVPIIQPACPAALATSTLQKLLGSSLPSYTFVDFCAGAGGPTPSIERCINEKFLRKSSMPTSMSNGVSEGAWMSKKPKKQPNGNNNGNNAPNGVDFVLTDLFPNTPAWSKAAKRSEHIHYVAQSVDAANAPPDLLAQAGFPTYGTTGTPSGRKSSSRKIFRLYNLAFHHFPDPLAEAILLNTLSTADGFAIFELQGRDMGNLFTVLFLWPYMWLGSWYWFWGDWWHLFFTYVVPVVPAVLVFDGLISCLRTRQEGEVKEMVRRIVAAKERAEPGTGGEFLDGWRFEAGGETHTWPGGSMQYFVGIRDER